MRGGGGNNNGGTRKKNLQSKGIGGGIEIVERKRGRESHWK